MKYTNILLSLLAIVTISCQNSSKESSDSDTLKVDSAKVDTIKAYDAYEVDERTELPDTLKKKDAPSLWTSKCVAYRTWRPS